MQYLQVKYAKMGQNCMNMYIKNTDFTKSTAFCSFRMTAELPYA